MPYNGHTMAFLLMREEKRLLTALLHNQIFLLPQSSHLEPPDPPPFPSLASYVLDLNGLTLIRPLIPSERSPHLYLPFTTGFPLIDVDPQRREPMRVAVYIQQVAPRCDIPEVESVVYSEGRTVDGREGGERCEGGGREDGWLRRLRRGRYLDSKVGGEGERREEGGDE